MIISEKQLNNFIKSYTRKLLSEARNKRGVENEFYRMVHQYTTHIFHDDAWQNVHFILDKIGEWADDFDVWVENGGYGQSRDGMSKYKDWQIKFIKDGIEFEGYLRANACGTMEDEWSAYDVVIIIW